jgi:uracil-DNA glycosylase
VGPAGQLLDKALAEAGVDRERGYVTNAVKHCKFEPRVKRRLHKRPNAGEIKICQRWLFEEIAATGPRLIVALGATAARSLAGQAIPVQANRGKILDGTNGCGSS